MKREPDFDGSADMRLIELQRAALGVAAPKTKAWESRSSPESGVSEPLNAQQPAGAVIVVEATATPSGDVIPGAIVTLALSISNEGVAEARAVRIAVPLPGGAAYRNGSFVRDGRPLLDDAADEFFGEGIALESIAPKSRVTFLWKIGVRLGTKPLVIAPGVRAEETAVIGALPLVISRKSGAQTGFAAQVEHVELPIYELDEEEVLEHEAAEAALSPVRAQPIEPPPLPDGPVDAFAEPERAAAREAVVLYGRLDRPSIAYFDQLFRGSKAPTLLHHCMLSGALACTRDAAGTDAAGFTAHMDRQSQLLQRIMLHERIGKADSIADYAGEMLAQVDRCTPQPVPPLRAPDDPNAVALEAELEAPTLAVLRRIQADAARWDFTTARQFTLALQARRIAANAPEERVAAAERALRNYSQTAATQLQRFFVKMRLDRTTGLLFTRDETLDAAARALVGALVDLFSASA